MYLAGTEARADELRAAQAMQVAHGAETRLMTPDQIADEYPFYDLTGIVLGSHGAAREGWFDGAAMVEAWRRMSRRAGADWRQGEVTGLDVEGGRITAARLADGGRIPCGAIVNAAGPRAGRLAAMAGARLPIEPRLRHTWVFRAASPLPRDLPLTIDPSGVHVRTDGDAYMAGAAPEADPAVDPSHFPDPGAWFEDHVWPVLAARIPAFETIRVTRPLAATTSTTASTRTPSSAPCPRPRT